MALAKKLSFDELYSSTTMFYVNKKYENEIQQEIDNKVDELYTEGLSLISRTAMKQYIQRNPNSLNNILLIRDVSEERFKRIISMLRKDKGFMISSEWSIKSTRTKMLESPSLMESIVDILWYGNKSPLNEKIPPFYMEDQEFSECLKYKLANKEIIRSFVKKGFEGKYSNNIGDLILNEVEEKLTDVCLNHGKTLRANERISDLDRTVSFVIEDPDYPEIIIDVSYCVTTSSSQGSKKEAARKTFEYVKDKRASGRKILYIYFLDGAGWIGRQADMQEIHRRADYTINFQNLNSLYDIFNDFYAR